MITRYALYRGNKVSIGNVKEHSTGLWVLYSDHLAAIKAAVAAERAELRMECCNLADQYGAMEAMTALFDARSK